MFNSTLPALIAAQSSRQIPVFGMPFYLTADFA
jgi:hypothetical protein